MNEIDSVLLEAGERWRAAQPAPRAIDPATFAVHRRSWMPEALMTAAGPMLAAVVVVAVVAVVVGQLGRSPGVGGPPAAGPTAGASEASASPSPSGSTPSGSTAAGASSEPCDVTRPEPIFVPPEGFPPEPPSGYGSEWFGTPELWVMLERDGETWNNLPSGPGGLSQKTFWWSADWAPEEEPDPDITVEGTRLDGPGTFTFEGGTNASADFGTAMLVGIDIPTEGCWRLTGTYRERYLSYVVLVGGD